MKTFVKPLQGGLDGLERGLVDVDVVQQLGQDFSGRFVASETGIGKEDVQQEEVPGLESGIIFGSLES